MDIVFKPEDESTTVMAVGPGHVFSLAREQSAMMRLVLIKRDVEDDPYVAMDIETGVTCVLKPTDRVIERPGVWCEDCADCAKAAESGIETRNGEG